MPKFANLVTIEIQPGDKDEFLPLLLAHKARCLRDEPGTLAFEILAPHGDDTKLLVCEIYRDGAAFDLHRNGPSFKRWQEETEGMVEKLYGTRCTIVE
jgi:quinol monooxygenase YgiN